MGIPAWVWFVIAAVAAVAGLTLLAVDRARETSRNRERARWASLRGWQLSEIDRVLATQWDGGAIGYYDAQIARDVVSGSTFTTDGRRQLYVFDIESGGRVHGVIVAVRCRTAHRALLELWLASVPFQRDEMPDLLGPVGQRYAFTDNVTDARPMITQELIEAADELGGDVSVAWLEGEWVLACVPPNVGPSRLERLLRDLGELADVVDPAAGGPLWARGRHARSLAEGAQQPEDAPEA